MVVGAIDPLLNYTSQLQPGDATPNQQAAENACWLSRTPKTFELSQSTTHNVACLSPWCCTDLWRRPRCGHRQLRTLEGGHVGLDILVIDHTSRPGHDANPPM